MAWVFFLNNILVNEKHKRLQRRLWYWSLDKYLELLFLNGFPLWTEAEFLDEIHTKKSSEFFSLLFTVTSTYLPWDLYFFKLTQPLTFSTVQLLCTVKEKGGKTDRKSYPLHYGGLINKSILKTQVWELSSLWPEIVQYVHEFGFSIRSITRRSRIAGVQTFR